MSTLIIITGASRGYGRSLALEFAKSLRERSIFLLLARNVEGLQETSRLIQEVHPSIPVFVHSIDLANLDSIETEFTNGIVKFVTSTSTPTLERCVLINNSGSLGDLKPVAHLSSLQTVRTAIDMNVTSTIWLTSLFLQILPSLLHKSNTTDTSSSSVSSSSLPSVIINISSLAAIKPMKSMLLYCAGKAARDMLFQGLAQEVENFTFPGSHPVIVKTLNYAPGPMATDMQTEINTSSTLDPELQTMFAKLKTENLYAPIDKSAAKCVRLIQENKFISGKHIDYYDEDI